jgi:hypothetical protein
MRTANIITGPVRLPVNNKHQQTAQQFGKNRVEDVTIDRQILASRTQLTSRHQGYGAVQCNKGIEAALLTYRKAVTSLELRDGKSVPFQ